MSVAVWAAPKASWPIPFRTPLRRMGTWLAAMRPLATHEPSLTIVEPGEPSLIQRRDPDAWHILFEREMPAIYRYTLSRLGNPGEAEDATSQVFEEAWKHADSFHDVGLPARAWLFGIARHIVGTHRRRWAGRPPQVALEAFDGSASDPALDPQLIDLARSIARLDRNHAEVISLRFIHGLSLQEAAAVLGTSVDGVKGRQARALAELRRWLEPGK